MLVASLTFCVATTTPSTEYTVVLSVQSIRYVCGAPRYVVPSEMSIGVVPARVLTLSAPPDRVLNIAHGASLRVLPSPTLWFAVDVNVATNSRDRPGAKVPVVRAHVPSTRSAPPLVVAPPPDSRTEDAKLAGKVVPPNSAPTAGDSVTSPSSVAETYVLDPVPAEKLALVVSAMVAKLVTNVAGAPGAAGAVAEFVAASTEVTR